MATSVALEPTLKLTDEQWKYFFTEGLGCNIRSTPTLPDAHKASISRQDDMKTRVSAVFSRPSLGEEINKLLGFLKNLRGVWNEISTSLEDTWNKHFFREFGFDPKRPDEFIGCDLAVIAHLNGLIDEHELANVFMHWTIFKFHSAEGNYTHQFKYLPRHLSDPVKAGEVVALFNSEGLPNPEAVRVVSSSLYFGATVLESTEKMSSFFAKMKIRPLSEQRMLRLPLPFQTGTGTRWEQSIMSRLSQMNIALFWPSELKNIVMPTSMLDAWLEVFFPYPVKIRPKFGAGMFEVAGRKAFERREREVLIRSPYQISSNVADGHDACGIMTTLHDYYHALTASFVSEKYHRLLLIVTDRFSQEAMRPGLALLLNQLYDGELTGLRPESFTMMKNYHFVEPDILFIEYLVNRIERTPDALDFFKILIEILNRDNRDMLSSVKVVLLKLKDMRDEQDGFCVRALQYIDSLAPIASLDR